MTRWPMLAALVGLALFPGGANGAFVWMELAAPPKQVVEDGQAGWEYWYDVHVQDDCLLLARLQGFDATQTINIYNGRLYQRWDASAAGYYIGRTFDHPSFRDYGAPDEWVLNPWVEWAMYNPLHAPSDYAGTSIWLYAAGAPSQDGAQFSPVVLDGLGTGLALTIRLVHPLAPGMITYEVDASDETTFSGQITGPVPEPTTLLLLSCGAMAMLKRRR